MNYTIFILVSNQTLQRVLTASVNRCMEIRMSAPSVASPVMAEFGGRVPESNAWSVVLSLCGVVL